MINCGELAAEIQRQGENCRGAIIETLRTWWINSPTMEKFSRMPRRFWRHKLLAWILIKGSGIEKMVQPSM